MPALVAAYLGYFGFHALSGSYGLSAHAEFRTVEAELSEQLDVLRAETELLERRAVLIRREGIDPDMVDEFARRALNVIAPNELVVLP